jgi:hypothetical protein
MSGKYNLIDFIKNRSSYKMGAEHKIQISLKYVRFIRNLDVSFLGLPLSATNSVMASEFKVGTAYSSCGPPDL